MSYRPEIDGLRGIAVLAVIVFHFEPFLFRGGLVGVDVFFVISGFLITTIILKEQSEGRFSVIAFWLRRIRRLYPALAVLVAFVAIAGNFLMINPERMRLVKYSLGTLGSVSNIVLWQTTGGYWASHSGEIPLLHTWSLSLEEQWLSRRAISTHDLSATGLRW